MKTNRKDISGVTLLELVTALSLIAVVGGIGAFSFSKYLTNSHLRKEATLLHETLRAAVLKSEQSEDRHLFSFNEGGWSLLRESTATTQLKHTFKPGLRLTLGANSRSEGTLAFYKTGIAMPATIKLSDGTSSCTIAVSLRGRITSKC